MRRGMAETARATAMPFAKRAVNAPAKSFKERALNQEALAAPNESTGAGRPKVKAERSPPDDVAKIGAASNTNTPQALRTGEFELWRCGMGMPGIGMFRIGIFRCAQQSRMLDA